jgi:hypothetical protein
MNSRNTLNTLESKINFTKNHFQFIKITLSTSRIVPPNQSLKLTEPAVDDFARAKQTVTIGQDLARADWIPLLRHFVAAA